MKLRAFDYLQKPFEIDGCSSSSSGRRAPAAPDRAPVSHQRARRRIQPLRHRRTQPPHAEVIATAEMVARSKARCSSPARPARQGWSRAIHYARPARDAAHQGQLRRDPETLLESGSSARAAPSPRLDQQEGQVRARRRRLDLPRQDHDERRSVEAARCSRSASSSRSDPSGRRAVDVRVIAATNRDLRGMVSMASSEDSTA